MIKPTFLKRDEAEARQNALQVLKPETSEAMRYVMRLNASTPEGSASAAAVAGFFVGGKTGTAEKVINGRYSKNKNFTTFTAVVPADKPKYVFLTIMDEPQAVEGTYGFSTAGWNAGPVTGNVDRARGAAARRAAALRAAGAAFPAHVAPRRLGQQPMSAPRHASRRSSSI